MPQCAVCSTDMSEEIDTPVGRTVVGTPEIDPTRGTKRYWDGVWYYFCGLGLQEPVRLGAGRLHRTGTCVTKLTLVTIVLTLSPECVART